MKGPFEAWRRNLWLWAIPCGFCLLNLAGLAVYRSFYSSEVPRLIERRLEGEQLLAARRTESERIDEFLAKAAAQQNAVERLYGEHFKTAAERFTDVLKEVDRLARDAGLDPTGKSYPETDLKNSDGLVERGIQFSVEGSYRQLRTFINFLELTDQFLTLNRISLAQSGPDRLSIRFELSTVFAPAERPAANTQEPDA